MYMVVWGYVNWEIGENFVLMLEEMYIFDEEQVLKYMDIIYYWKLKYVMKKRFDSFSFEE